MTLENYLILLLGVILVLVLIAIKNFIFIEKLKYDIYVLKHIALHQLNELEKLKNTNEHSTVKNVVPDICISQIP